MHDLTTFSKNVLKPEKDSVELIKLPSWNICAPYSQLLLNTSDAVDHKTYYTPYRYIVSSRTYFYH